MSGLDGMNGLDGMSDVDGVQRDDDARRLRRAGAQGVDGARWALEEACDGEVPSTRAEMLQRHLADCPECAQEVERMRRMKELMRRSCCESAPDSLRERITIEYRRISVSVRRTQR